MNGAPERLNPPPSIVFPVIAATTYSITSHLAHDEVDKRLDTPHRDSRRLHDQIIWTLKH